jgi:hypothetical protein
MELVAGICMGLQLLTNMHLASLIYCDGDGQVRLLCLFMEWMRYHRVGARIMANSYEGIWCGQSNTSISDIFDMSLAKSNPCLLS